MKLGKNLPPPTSSDKRMLAFSVTVFLATCVLVMLAINSRNAPRTSVPVGDSQTGVTTNGTPMSPQVIAQLTAIPSAAPLTGPLADEVRALGKMVGDCTDYSDQRRAQMNQHIAWLLKPSTLPQDVVIALGSNVNGRLMFGMATYTLSEWGLHQKSSTSCLLTIGKKLNDMLAANGEARFAEFDTP